MDFDDELERVLLDPVGLRSGPSNTPDLRFAADCHACTHMTLSPNVLRADGKTNTIPGRSNSRSTSGPCPARPTTTSVAVLEDLIGDDLIGRADIHFMHEEWLAASPIDSPPWRACRTCLGVGLPRRPLRAGDHAGWHRRPVLPPTGRPRTATASSRGTVVRRLRVDVPRRTSGATCTRWR
ncbi:MAG: hypothetical protein R2697_05600 [Ilumatobacteraceae bacterium]